MRLDLSHIHPLQRVTLIVVWFMFGVSLSMGMASQFVSFEAKAGRIGQDLQFIANSHGFVLARRIHFFSFQLTGFDYGFVPRDDSPGMSASWRWTRHRGGQFMRTCSIPGLALYKHDPGLHDGWALQVHHAWVISITAAVYFFTRWRIRRSASRSQTNFPGPLRTSSNSPDRD